MSYFYIVRIPIILSIENTATVKPSLFQTHFMSNALLCLICHRSSDRYCHRGHSLFFPQNSNNEPLSYDI